MKYQVHEYLIVMKTHEVEAASVEEAVRIVMRDEDPNVLNGVVFSEVTGDFLVDEMQGEQRIGSYLCNIPGDGKIRILRTE